MKFKTLIVLIGLLTLTSCAAHKNILYFQDTRDGSTNTIATVDGRIRIQPDDVLSIIVKSRDTDLTSLFNLPYYTQRLGANSELNTGYSNGVATYHVNESGDIFFPVVGKVHVGGQTRCELAEDIQNRLIGENLVKDPVVSVDWVNLNISVLGDVVKPGRVKVDHDEFTILDAISAAGDLTITGKRADVRVMRNENGTQKTYCLDLRNADEITHSPAYYLRQNDVVYVSPNNMKSRQSTVNGNNVLNASFWISLSSLAVTVLLAVNQFTLTRK